MVAHPLDIEWQPLLVPAPILVLFELYQPLHLLERPPGAGMFQGIRYPGTVYCFLRQTVPVRATA